MRALCAVILVVVCLNGASAETPEELNNKGVRLFREGKFKEAEQVYRATIQLHDANGRKDISAYAAVLNNLASTLQSTGNIAEARRLLVEVVSLGPAIRDDQTTVTHALNNLALLHSAEREYPKAIALLQKALQQAGDPRTRAGTLHNLGATYFEMGQFKKSEELFEESIRLHKAAGAIEQIPSSMTFLARLAWREGDTTRSLALLDKSLSLRREAFGPTHPLVGISLNDIAERLRDAERFKEADASFEEAMRVFAAGVGVDSLYAAPVLFHYAESKRLQGNHQEALALYQRSIAILTRSFGPGHARLINVYKCAAISAAKLKRKNEAKEYQKLARALEGTQVQYGQHTVDVSAFAPMK